MKRLALLCLAACTPDEITLGAFELDAGSSSLLDAQREVPEDASEADARAPAPFPYFEAEDGQLTGGFARVDAADASAGAALVPPSGSFDDAPGQARASYRFSVPRADSYVLWGRMQAPGAGSNRVWFAIDDGSWFKWRISTGDIWYWDDLHDDTDYGNPLRFTLTAGEHTLTLANCVGGFRLDRFYVTADGDTPPGNTTTCHPPHSIELAGVCQPSCGAQSGTRCGEQSCAGIPLIVAYDCAICCSAP